MDKRKTPPQRCGEPAITSMGAVIANAVLDAIGGRLFAFPITPKRIKGVLSKKRDASSEKKGSIPASPL